MKLLLDSCVFLWMIDDYKKIPSATREKITSPLNEIYLSSISIVEMTIKAGLGKLSIPKPFAEFIIDCRKKHGINELALKEEDVIILEKLPLIHSDPFDRMLVAQAIANEMAIISCDKKIKDYPVSIVWS